MCPKLAHLMSVVNTQHIVLLYDFLVPILSLFFELRNDSLAQINGEYVMQHLQRLDILIGLHKQLVAERVLTDSILFTILPVSSIDLKIVFTVFLPVVTLSRVSCVFFLVFSFC